MVDLDIILLAIGLSMDSLAVSIASGAVIRKYNIYNVCKIAFVLAVFQGGMTALGYLAGYSFEHLITAIDHWIAFMLLFYLGGKMIYEAYEPKGDNTNFDPLKLKTMIGLGIATSIDALAIGISLALLRSPILVDATVIAVVTFIFSAFGIYFGKKFGAKTNLKIELIGGLILVGIGLKILLEHTLLA